MCKGFESNHLSQDLICDGTPQCDDGSDEEEGCRLFDLSGCPSVRATQRFQCQYQAEQCRDNIIDLSGSILCSKDMDLSEFFFPVAENILSVVDLFSTKIFGDFG